MSVWYAVTSRHPRNTRACSFKIQAVLCIGSWNDLTTAERHTRVSQLEGRRGFLSTSPQQTLSFFSTHIAHAVGHRPHTALTCLAARDIYAPAQDGWPGQCKTPVGNHGCLTHRKRHGTRQLPLWPVVDSSRCLRLASAPPWEHLPPLIH
jgi:hypothetical protein